MNLKANSVAAVAASIVVFLTSSGTIEARADVITEKRMVGPGVVEYEKHLVAPVALSTETTRIIESPVTVAPTAAATVTTTEKIFEQETERWTGSGTSTRRLMTRRPALRHRTVKRVAMRRPTAHRHFIARRAAVKERLVTRIVEKPVIVERPTIIEKTVVVEKPVVIERQIEKPVFIDRIIERPVAVQTIIERPVERTIIERPVERIIEQPVVIEKKVIIKKKHRHSLIKVGPLGLL